MATKKDLLEAQRFSRARLLSAFLGGSPGGKELEPAKPLRAVIAGIALTAMLVIAGLFIGMLKPGLPSGWENNRLIVARDTGARYVSVQGTLHPVINTVSARMLIPAGEFRIVSVDQSTLAGIPVGGTIGILGGPDTLPRTEALAGTDWYACASPKRTELWIGEGRAAAATPGTGTVVTREGETFVIAAGTSYAVPAQHRTAVLRAVGLDTVAPAEVRGDWLALFPAGAEFAPLTTPGAGGTVARAGLPAGTVIHPTGSPEDELYLLTGQGELAPLSPLAFRLYLLGGGADGLGDPVELGPAEIADLPTTEAAGSAGWPQRVLQPQTGSGAPCATLAGSSSDQRTALTEARGLDGGAAGTATAAAAATETPLVAHVAESAGALVRGGRSGALTLVDATGIAYAVPGDPEQGALRLGYEMTDVAVLPASWLRLLPAGPELTPAAAGATPQAP